MKRKLLLGTAAVALIAGTAFATIKATYTVAYYYDGSTCRTVTLTTSSFTDTGGGTQASIATQNGGAQALLYTGAGSNGATCNGTPIYFND